MYGSPFIGCVSASVKSEQKELYSKRFIVSCFTILRRSTSVATFQPLGELVVSVNYSLIRIFGRCSNTKAIKCNLLSLSYLLFVYNNIGAPASAGAVYTYATIPSFEENLRL